MEVKTISTVMSEPNVTDFRYVDLKEVDPTFELLDPEMYELRISKAEFRTFNYKQDNPAKGISAGDEGRYVNMSFTVANHPKFSGRKYFHSFWLNQFDLKNLRRIADAAGVEQKGTMEEWLQSLSSIQPSVRLKIDKVPDTVRQKNSDGTYVDVPNPKTANPDGTPQLINKIDWRAGVQTA